jgi:hypothetical protein
MLRLRQFRAMADSYGGDLQRWPQEMRREAQALLNVSPQARAFLEEARALDDAIATASARSDAAARRIGEDDAVLAKLRSGVAARIAVPMPRRQPAGWHHARALFRQVKEFISANLVWVGMATSGSLAVFAGFLFGTLYASPPASDLVLSILQPVHILAD